MDREVLYSTRSDLLIQFYILIPIMVIVLLSAWFTKAHLLIGIELAFFGVLFIVSLLFSSLRVELYSREIHFHYGPFGKRIPLKEIKSIEAVRIRPIRDFLGWGIRLGRGRTIGYIAEGGAGLRIETNSGGRYVVTCPQPESLVLLIRMQKRGLGR